MIRGELWSVVDAALEPKCSAKTLQELPDDSRVWLSEPEYAMAVLQWVFGYREWVRGKDSKSLNPQDLRNYLQKSPYRIFRATLLTKGMADGLADMIGSTEHSIAKQVYVLELFDAGKPVR